METNLYTPTNSAKAMDTSTPVREVLYKMIAWQSNLLKLAQKPSQHLIHTTSHNAIQIKRITRLIPTSFSPLRLVKAISLS